MNEVNIDRFDSMLSFADSGTRAGVLVACLKEATPEEGNLLLQHWFNLCDALRPWQDDLREEFHRVGWVADTDQELEMPCRVYRGAWHDDEVEHALSWTLDIEVAQKFCRIISGPRGWFLGTKRDDAIPTVFQGICTSALGYLNERHEHEVIVDVVEDIEPIQQLLPAPTQ